MRFTGNPIGSCRFGLAVLVLAAPGLAPAATTEAGRDDIFHGEEIVVVAQRREELSVDVPITITTLDEQALQSANVEALSDIMNITPGLRFDFAGPFYQPTIRGVGTAVTTSGGAGNVGTYLDGFYSPNPLMTDLDLMNIRSIQVLKGPQGTLFGRNTTGGAILVQTAEPSTENAGELKASYGRYDETRLQGYATFGLTDKIAVDIEGLYRGGDGWRYNISNGEKVGEYDNWSIRTGLRAELSETVSMLLRYQHGDVDDPNPLLTASYMDPELGSGAPYFAQPGEVTFDRKHIGSGSHPSDQEYYQAKSDIVQLTIKADLGFADLTSYSQYRDEDVDSSIELDYSGVELIQLGLPNKNETWTQEFLLSTKPGSRLQGTAGLFYFDNEDRYIVYYDYFPGFGIMNRSDFSRFGSSTTTKSIAGFVDATYEVTPRLFLTAGARYARDWIEDAYWIEQFGYPTRNYVKQVDPENYDRPDDTRLTPRLVIRYKPTDESSIYASYTRGYKAALLDVGGNRGNYVKPEEIDAWEVGYKYDDRRWLLETSAFYYDYDDLQVSVYKQGQAEIRNAATSEIYGIDAQTSYGVTENFTVNAGAAWVHARYEEFDNAPVYMSCVPMLGPALCGIATFIIPEGSNLRNATMQRTPEFSGNVGASYRTALAGGELVFSGNLYYTSRFYFGPSGIQFKQGDYEVLSLRVEWTDPGDRYTIALWGDNLTNESYLTQVQYNQPGIGANWSQPATYGVEVGMKF